MSKSNLKVLQESPHLHQFIKHEEVEWVINEMGEIGVKIKDQFFFLYKGRSYDGGSHWRPVYKREFGECCHPWDLKPRNVIHNGISYEKEDDGCLVTSEADGWSKKPSVSWVKCKYKLKRIFKIN